MAPIISHEIRNPLAVIGNSAYFVKSKLEILKVSDAKVVKHLSHIETELRHANDVLEDMLLYARMKEPALSATPLMSIVSDALGELPVPANVKLENKLSAKSPAAMVDPELATRSLRHVVRNASGRRRHRQRPRPGRAAARPTLSPSPSRTPAPASRARWKAASSSCSRPPPRTRLKPPTCARPPSASGKVESSAPARPRPGCA